MRKSCAKVRKIYAKIRKICVHFVQTLNTSASSSTMPGNVLNLVPFKVVIIDIEIKHRILALSHTKVSTSLLIYQFSYAIMRVPKFV